MTLNEHCTVRNHASGFQRLGRCLDPFILFGWIGSLCFADSLLRSFEMPSSLVELRGGVFNNCHMTSERFISQDYAYVVCGCLLLNRDFNACYGSVCGVMEIVIPSDVVELWDKCFSECRNLERVTFEIHCLGCIFTSSTKLERIGSLAFTETSIDSIRIPESVVEVCDRCFYDAVDFCVSPWVHHQSLSGLVPVHSVRRTRNLHLHCCLCDGCFCQCK